MKKNVSIKIVILAFIFFGVFLTACQSQPPAPIIIQQMPNTAPTQIPEPPKINVFILGCSTGTEGFNEITNAWVTVQNVGGSNAENVLVSIVASDSDKEDPRSSETVNFLAPNHQITFLLIADTKWLVDTSIDANVSFDLGTSRKELKDTYRNCKQMSLEQKQKLEELGQIGADVLIKSLDEYQQQKQQP